MKLRNPKSIIILGYPLEHTLSPLMHNFAFDYHGLDFTYNAYPIAPERMSELGRDFLKILPIYGGSVTVPFKEKIFNYIDKFSPEASEVGAVNTFYKKDGLIYGDNTDVYGFMESVRDYKDSFTGKTVMMLGTGGSAKAVITALAHLKVKNIIIVSRDIEKANVFISNKNALYPDIKMISLDYNSILSYNQIKECSVVINTTPLGMYENISPLEESVIKDLAKDTIVYDLIYNPERTRFLKMAESFGLTVINGKMMLIHQAAKAFRIWTGKEFPIDEVSRLF